MTGRAALLAAVALAAGCNKKRDEGKQALPPADVAGLAAAPASTRVVMGIDPARLGDSPLIARAGRLLVERDADLGARLERLAASCNLDWRRQLRSVHLVRTSDSDRPMMIATGELSEPDLAKCVQNNVGAGGGSVALEQVDGRTLYHVTEGDRSVWFGFGQRDTVVLSADRALVVAGLGTGPKALDDADTRALVEKADTKAPIWAAGRIDAALGQRLTTLTQGRVTTPPRAFLAAIDATDGLDLSLTAVMADEEQAKAMESQLDPLLSVLALYAQARGLGPIAAKLGTTREVDRVRIGLDLSAAEVNEVLSKVDSRPPVAQDAGPVTPPPSADAGVAADARN